MNKHLWNDFVTKEERLAKKEKTYSLQEVLGIILIGLPLLYLLCLVWFSIHLV